MRFDDRVTGNLAHYAPNAKKIHIEIDPPRSTRTSAPTSPSSAISKRSRTPPPAAAEAVGH